MVENTLKRYISSDRDVPRLRKALFAFLTKRFPGVAVVYENTRIAVTGSKATVRRVQYMAQSYRMGWLDNEATDQ